MKMSKSLIAAYVFATLSLLLSLFTLLSREEPGDIHMLLNESLITNENGDEGIYIIELPNGEVMRMNYSENAGEVWTEWLDTTEEEGY